MNLEETLRAITPADQAAHQAALDRWNAIAKPLNGLGLLEEAVARLAGIQRTVEVDISKRAVVAMCADNGVVAEGVTQTEQEVTAIVTENMSKGLSSVCCMARVAHADMVPVDIGVYRPVEGEKLLRRCVRRGTANMVHEPAMTRAEAVRAIEVGIDVAEELAQKGYRLLCTGEMGIGNTTTSSAVAAVMLGVEPATVTGRGAGLSTAGLQRKIKAIETAIALHQPDKTDPVGVLAAVGGLDIAGLVGVFLGGAKCHIPVVIDGFISAVAALCAMRLCPAAGDYFMASHVSKEPAGCMMLEALGLTPVIRAEMCLGEGTGAVAALPLFDMALAVYREMPTFTETSVETYTPQV